MHLKGTTHGHKLLFKKNNKCNGLNNAYNDIGVLCLMLRQFENTCFSAYISLITTLK